MIPAGFRASGVEPSKHQLLRGLLVPEPLAEALWAGLEVEYPGCILERHHVVVSGHSVPAEHRVAVARVRAVLERHVHVVRDGPASVRERRYRHRCPVYLKFS